MPGWALLDTHKYAPKEFGSLLDFAYKWLDAPELSFKIAYNFEYSRIDFKAFDNANNRQVTIGFEPGYPKTMVSHDN
jgi:hypothetical protein